MCRRPYGSGCSFLRPPLSCGSGTGQFRPLAGAHPAIGEVGRLERVAENRVELTFPRPLRPAVVGRLLEAHPYEEPAFHVLRNAWTDAAG